MKKIIAGILAAIAGFFTIFTWGKKSGEQKIIAQTTKEVVKSVQGDKKRRNVRMSKSTSDKLCKRVSCKK